ncbi:MAG: hypothetical protein ABIR47_01025 [Candidatus Kapaibacterium sp.]
MSAQGSQSSAEAREADTDDPTLFGYHDHLPNARDNRIQFCSARSFVSHD